MSTPQLIAMQKAIDNNTQMLTEVLSLLKRSSQKDDSPLLMMINSKVELQNGKIESLEAAVKDLKTASEVSSSSDQTNFRQSDRESLKNAVDSMRDNLMQKMTEMEHSQPKNNIDMSEIKEEICDTVKTQSSQGQEIINNVVECLGDNMTQKITDLESSIEKNVDMIVGRVERTCADVESSILSKLCDLTSSVGGLSEDLQNLNNRLLDAGDVSCRVSVETSSESSTALSSSVSGGSENFQDSKHQLKHTTHVPDLENVGKREDSIGITSLDRSISEELHTVNKPAHSGVPAVLNVGTMTDDTGVTSSITNNKWSKQITVKQVNKVDGPIICTIGSNNLYESNKLRGKEYSEAIDILTGYEVQVGVELLQKDKGINVCLYSKQHPDFRSLKHDTKIKLNVKILPDDTTGEGWVICDQRVVLIQQSIQCRSWAWAWRKEYIPLGELNSRGVVSPSDKMKVNFDIELL